MNKINQLETTALELFECGNIELVDQVFAEAYIAHDSSKEYRGREFVKTIYRENSHHNTRY